MFERWRPGVHVASSVDHGRKRWRLEAQDGDHTKILLVSLPVLENASGEELVSAEESRFRAFFSEPRRVKKEISYLAGLGPSWHDRSDVEV